INEAEVPDTIVVLDVPLLYESGMYRDISDIIVVYATPAQQMERLIARDSLTEVDARARIHAQMPIDEKRARTDMVIDNTGTPEETLAQVDKLFEVLKTKAAGRL
ncbi:MAG: dephospho-CoA kinase, partial [Thermodesulfobacteriota bacterium]